jgi:hypothetical protein
MDELLETVNLAVAKMQQRKQERDALQRKRAELLDTLSRLDMEEKKRQDELKIRLREMVKCIHDADASFVVQDDQLLVREKEIRFRMQSIETGMGNIHLFVKTTADPTKEKTLVVEGNHIRFASVPEPFINPFTFVYDKTDNPDTPGEKNFQLYLEHLLDDLDRHENYAAIAYGPSGTGKTTMIQRVVKHLYEMFQKPPIEVYQAYVRAPMIQKIPETQGNNFTRLIDGGIRHEKFDLRTVDESVDVVKVFLNDVQMIETVGTQMFGYGRTLYRMVYAMYDLKFVNPESEHAEKFMANIDLGLAQICEILPNGELQLQVGRIREFLNNDYLQIYHFLDGFQQMIQERWIKPISDTVDLLNKARSTLHTLLTNRFEKEKAYVNNSNRSVEDEEYFIRSGGFIPLHWLRYMDPTYVEPVLFFKDLDYLTFLKTVSAVVYFGSKVHSDLDVRPYWDKYFLFFTPQTANLYFRPPETTYADLHELQEDVAYSRRDLLDIRGLQNQRTIQETIETNERIVRAKEKIESLADLKTAALTKYVQGIRNVRPRVMINKTLDPETQLFQIVSKKEDDATRTDTFIDEVQKFSFQRSTPQNQQSSRCATVYVLHIGPKTVTFIDLPGNEDQMTGCELEKDDNVLCTETLGIRVLLKYVRELMTVKRLNIVPEDIGMSYPSRLFADLFKPLMNPTCKVGFLCFAANYAASPNYTENTRTTLHYMAGLKTASYSCEGKNQQIAKDLIAEYAAKDAEEKAKRLELFPETEKPSLKPLKSTTVNDDYPVERFRVPKGYLLPYKNVVPIPKKATIMIYYSVRDNKDRIKFPECFLYKFTCNGILDFNNDKNAIRFTNVENVTFECDGVVNVNTGKKRIFDFNESTSPFWQALAPARWTDVQMKETYEIQRNVSKTSHLPYLVNGDKSYTHPFGYVDLPHDREKKLSFKPSLISINFLFHNDKSEVIIIPKKYHKPPLQKFEWGFNNDQYMSYEIIFFE